MSLQRSIMSIESTCTLLTCTSKEFWDFYENTKLATPDFLCSEIMNVINENQQYLHTVDNRFSLDALLDSMLRYTPHPDGKRYVAVALHIAQKKGDNLNVVVDLAKAWMENLFLPMFYISKTIRPGALLFFPDDPDSDLELEPAICLSWREFREKLAIREKYYCAITHTIDCYYVKAQGRRYKTPAGVHACHVDGVHIMTFLFDKSTSTTNIPNITEKTRDAAVTWDMLQCWTGSDINALVGPDINSPANGIFINCEEHIDFRQFGIYFDKDVSLDSPNKYLAKVVDPALSLSNGKKSAEVEFPTLAQSGVEPPNPKLLAIHASLAKVLHLNGAIDYSDRVESKIE